jgi:hypothetical protein
MAEAAKLLRVSLKTVYRHQDDLHVISVGGRKFIL